MIPGQLTDDNIRALPKLRSVEVRVDDVDKDARTVVSIINTAGTDRYRTIIMPNGRKLDKYLLNPVVLLNHDTAWPVGRNLWIKYRKAKNDLIAKTYFDTDTFSDQVYQKVVSDGLRAWSIRFEPDYTKSSPPTEDEIKADKRFKDCLYVYRAWELLEYSVVTIPGNADCLTLPNERSLNSPEDARKFLADLRSEPAPAKEPEPTAPPIIELPRLTGARTFEHVFNEAINSIRNVSGEEAVRRALKQAIDRKRGRID